MKAALVVGAFAAGAVLVAVALGGSTNPVAAGSRVYCGSASGVSLTLTVPLSSRVRPRLAFQFTTEGEAVWRRALAAGKLEAFCSWVGPDQNETGSNTVDIAIDSTHRTQTFGVDPSRSGRSYTCGLHIRTEGPHPGQTWSDYVRHALVAVRLALSSPATVATGTFRGGAWRLTATDSADGSYCITMTPTARRNDASTECGSIFGMGGHGISYLSHTGRPLPNYIVGPVVATARVVQITLSTGEVLGTNTLAPPASLSARIAFYRAELPCGVYPSRVVALDRAGHTVAQLHIRLRPAGTPSC